MAVSARRVTVGTTASRLDADGSDTISGHSVLIVAQASGTLVLGGSGVTAATGARVPVVAGTQISVDLDQSVNSPTSTEAIYGIVASGSIDVDVLIQGG